jgi:hypothetical protein
MGRMRKVRYGWKADAQAISLVHHCRANPAACEGCRNASTSRGLRDYLGRLEAEHVTPMTGYLSASKTWGITI